MPGDSPRRRSAETRTESLIARLDALLLRMDDVTDRVVKLVGTEEEEEEEKEEE